MEAVGHNPRSSSEAIARRAKRGFTLLEMVMALGISSIALSGLFSMSNMVMEKTQARLISSQALAVASAARGFVVNNKTTVLAGLPAINDAAEMLVSDMQDMGYLPADFVNQNAYGQTYKILVKREDAGTAGPDEADMLVILVVTTGGQTITDKMGSALVGAMGAAGGFIFSDLPTTARGAAGGWQVDLSGDGWADIAGYTPAAGTLALLANILPKGADGWSGGDSILVAGDAACHAGNQGKVRWSDSANTLQVCDGTNWKALMVDYDPGEGEPYVPPAGSGYFVLSAGMWDSNLGGTTGADAKCLADLTANNWMGKADATARGLLNSSKIQAFLCNNARCNQALPLVTYYFAVSGDDTKGGASFTTNASGVGPNNSQNWAGMNYFGGNVYYFVGRQTGTNLIWNLSSTGGSICSNYTSNDISFSTNTNGYSNNTGVNRYVLNSFSCSIPLHLICMVHP